MKTNNRTLLGLLALVMLSAPALAQSPNERVHVLQKRDYSVKNKVEVSLFGGLSVDDVFTQHYALSLSLDYHIDEAFALELQWMTCKLPFWSNGDAYFGNHYTQAYTEVKNDAQLSPSNADLAMLNNVLSLDVQFSPIYGKWTLFNRTLGHADIYLSAGGGVGSTAFRNAAGDWVDTGVYFVGNFGLGFRIFLARWLAIRLDVRDYTFSARVRSEGGTSTGATDETKIRNTLFVMLGVSFLFGGEEPVQIWSPY